MGNPPSNLPNSGTLTHSDGGVADEMKRKTSVQHRMAEKSGVVADILKRTVKFSDYVLYLRNLSAVYETIESPSEVNSSAFDLNTFLDSSLARSSSLKLDLDNLMG